MGRMKAASKNKIPRIEELINLSKKLKEEFGDIEGKTIHWSSLNLI